MENHFFLLTTQARTILDDAEIDNSYLCEPSTANSALPSVLHTTHGNLCRAISIPFMFLCSPFPDTSLHYDTMKESSPLCAHAAIWSSTLNLLLQQDQFSHSLFYFKTQKLLRSLLKDDA